MSLDETVLGELIAKWKKTHPGQTAYISINKSILPCTCCICILNYKIILKNELELYKKLSGLNIEVTFDRDNAPVGLSRIIFEAVQLQRAKNCFGR